MVARRVIVVFGVGIFAVWIVERSPIFRVDHFVVTGNSTVTSDDVVTLLQGSMSRHRTFLFSLLGMDNMLVWPTSLATSDLALIPQLANVTLEKKLRKPYDRHIRHRAHAARDLVRNAAVRCERESVGR